jgi:hypothetical protein
MHREGLCRWEHQAPAPLCQMRLRRLLRVMHPVLPEGFPTDRCHQRCPTKTRDHRPWAISSPPASTTFREDLDLQLSAQATFRHLQVEGLPTRWLEELHEASPPMHSVCTLVSNMAVQPTQACHMVPKDIMLTGTTDLIPPTDLVPVNGNRRRDLHLCPLELAIPLSTMGLQQRRYPLRARVQPLDYRCRVPLRTDLRLATTPATSRLRRKPLDRPHPLKTTLARFPSSPVSLSRPAT